MPCCAGYSLEGLAGSEIKIQGAMVKGSGCQNSKSFPLGFRRFVGHYSIVGTTVQVKFDGLI